MECRQPDGERSSCSEGETASKLCNGNVDVDSRGALRFHWLAGNLISIAAFSLMVLPLIDGYPTGDRYDT